MSSNDSLVDLSRKHSLAELRYIAEDLIEELRECEDGTDITTWQLLKTVGYDTDEFSDVDLAGIHMALFRAAKANHITLDMSAHEGKLEGLPYNLDFIVKNKRAQIKCPHCGSKNTARYIYGYPAFTDEMIKKLDAGKWKLGGCVINDVEVDGQYIGTQPTRKCNDCKKDFATPPIMINKKAGTVEDYRDIVTAIRFSLGDFFGGNVEITIKSNPEGAAVDVDDFRFSDHGFMTYHKQITNIKWRRIVNTLYGQLYIHEWKKKYEDSGVLDGTQWSLEIELTNRRIRSYHGSNAYPPYWRELLKIFKEFAKL